MVMLGDNQYGKAQIRLMKVDRDAETHVLHDLNVSVTLSGDLAATHLDGDNSGVLPTDSQKNTVYAFAREHGIGQIEDFALRLARHFVDATPTVSRARVLVEEHPWQRVTVSGQPTSHSFVQAGAEARTATVTYDGQGVWVLSGITDLVLLSSTDSEFTGYLRDPYTTLPEATDRILCTSVNAQWRHSTPAAEVDWEKSFDAARTALTEAFADTYSRSLQQTLYAMGQRLVDSCDTVSEVRLSLPNRHHFLVDLAPFGLDNPGQVFHVADRPYGLIEGTVLADDAVAAPEAW
ncbi:MAG TPA: urate oxidase [Nocardioidaceae bacterium]|nr:urate oxidase [Nocardioidaceae bacterium]